MSNVVALHVSCPRAAREAYTFEPERFEPHEIAGNVTFTLAELEAALLRARAALDKGCVKLARYAVADALKSLETAQIEADWSERLAREGAA